jgi:hypothetical protein
VRLKPGRKQTKKSQKEAEPEAAWNKDPDNDPHFGSRVSTEEGGQSDNEEEYPYHPGYSGGRTTHHKIKDKLAEVHIDAPWLRTNGHSLINLRSIGKHMRCAAFLHSREVTD